MVQKTGFYNQNERWADNRQMYRDVLSGVSRFCDQQEARRQLEHYERFSPEVPHDRLIAHSLLVYCIQKPVWGKGTPRSKVVTPTGARSIVLEADFGVELVRIAGGELYIEEVVGQGVVRDLGDGTFLRGTLFRKVLPKESALRSLEEYVTITFDTSGYVFAPRKEIQQREKVYGYEITSYVSIDGQKVSQFGEFCLPGFHTEDSGRSGFKQWVTKRFLETEYEN